MRQLQWDRCGKRAREIEGQALNRIAALYLAVSCCTRSLSHAIIFRFVFAVACHFDVHVLAKHP